MIESRLAGATHSGGHAQPRLAAAWGARAPRRLSAILRIALAVSIIAAGLGTVPGVAVADGALPITETFKNSTAPGWVVAGTAYLTAPTVDPEGSGWLRLTNTGNDQAGSAYYDTAFPSSLGIYVSFEYTSWGGTNPGADGLGFFLFDGSTPSFRIGDAGGSLGYANGCGAARGVSNGYVGIGVDEWGNFAAYDTARCHHLCYGWATQQECIDNYARVPHSVTIRGSGDGDESAIHDYYYLTSTGTIPGHTIDIPNQTSRPDLSGDNYRKVVMVITEDELISVWMQFGADSTLTTLIDEFDLGAQPYQAARPDTFKLGFFGATGGSTNYHELRNVTVAVPADVQLTKTVDSAAPCEGDAITYTLTLKNNGPSANVTSVQVTDLLPAGVTYSSSVPSQGTYTSSTGLWDIGTVPVGGNATLRIVATVDAGTENTTITNRGNVTQMAQGDPDPSNNEASVDIHVGGCPVWSQTTDVEFQTGTLVDVITSNDNVVLDTVSGNATYNYVGVTRATNDHYAWYCDVDAMPPTGGNLNTKTEATDAQYSQISADDTSRWETFDPEDGDEVFMWFDMHIDEDPSTITNIALTFDGYPRDGDTNFSIHAYNTVTANWNQIGASESIPYRTYETFTRSITSNFDDYIDGAGTLTWGVYEDLSSQYIRVDYLQAEISYSAYDTPGTITSAPITPDDLGGWGNFTASDTIPGPGNISYRILKASDNSTLCTITAAQAAAGYDISSCAGNVASIKAYAQLTTSDNDYTPMLHDWTITYTTLYELVVTSDGCCPVVVGLPGGNQTVPAGGNDTFSVACGLHVPLWAVESAACEFQQWGGNVSDPSSPSTTVSMCTDRTVRVYCTTVSADLELDKQVDNPHPCEGGNVTYTVTVSNNGPANATGVVVNDLLPPGLTYVGNSTSQGTYDRISGNWTVGSVNSGAGATLTITAMLDPGTGNTTIRNWGNVTHVDQNDPTPANNADYADINVRAAPGCTIAAPSAVCALSAGNTASVPAGNGTTSYYWGITGGNITAGANTTQITWTAGSGPSANITISVIDGSGCECSGNRTVTLNPLPSCTITAPTGVCAGSGNNTASVPDAGGNATYNWLVTGQGTLTGGNNTPSITWDALAAGNATLSVTVTDSNGCQCSGGRDVTISVGPAATASSNSPVCLGGTILLSGGPDGMSSYSWAGPGNFTSNEQNPGRGNATLEMAGDYTVTVTDGDACSGNATTSVTVSSPVDCTITAPFAVCAQSTGNTASVPSATGNATYDWNVTGGTITAGNNTRQITWTAGSGSPAQISVTVDNGCQCSGNKSVTVYPRPTATASSNSPVCPGETIVLTGGPNGMTDYSWTGPGGFTSHDQSPTQPNATEAMSGTYILTVTDAYGCASVPASTAVAVVNNTPVGQQVTATSGTSSVTFTEVTTSGCTSITTTNQNPGGSLPVDMCALLPYVDITTTAETDPPITVGLGYDPSKVSNENTLRLYHWESPNWVDCTTSVDTVNNIIYGEVDELSPFCIGYDCGCDGMICSIVYWLVLISEGLSHLMNGNYVLTPKGEDIAGALATIIQNGMAFLGQFSILLPYNGLSN